MTSIAVLTIWVVEDSSLRQVFELETFCVHPIIIRNGTRLAIETVEYPTSLYPKVLEGEPKIEDDVVVEYVASVIDSHGSYVWDGTTFVRDKEAGAVR